jgi:hypothetical protein
LHAAHSPETTAFVALEAADAFGFLVAVVGRASVGFVLAILEE